jgi:hypothetical protein
VTEKAAAPAAAPQSATTKKLGQLKSLLAAPAAAPQSATTKKLEQLKSLLSEGLITQAQYQKASQQVLNEMVQ